RIQAVAENEIEQLLQAQEQPLTRQPDKLHEDVLPEPRIEGALFVTSRRADSLDAGQRRGKAARKSWLLLSRSQRDFE
ncbi:MAG TPA: hypothetical protein VEI74_09100, partial [Candidatus Methylomirabilis sp.]|nr:hypothetical protein [Candidatus Methylomirabilis sp.]